ncbi:Glycosyl transferase, family 19 [Dillenia turbinata]|uniref:lipid-A-disaccharide synthase n=1 Tax=Dillenia turbinata TaxID=194707 RepID=A0AAN8V0U2_9MAGN
MILNAGKNVGFPRILFSRSLSVSSKAAIDMAAKDGELRVFIVTGEVSGDLIGSRLMASLKKLSPYPVNFAGVGGPIMSKQGLRSLFPMEEIAGALGTWELFQRLNKISENLKKTVEAAYQFRPHVVVTVDSKGFSFRLLKKLRERYSLQMCPLHFHYVAPPFWAWRGGEAQLRRISKFVDHIFCILPSEEDVCRAHRIDATFVGHPMLEDVLEINQGEDISTTKWKVRGNSEDFYRRHEITSGATVMSLLPGSRLKEVCRMLPIFSDTVKLLRESFLDLMTVIHVPSNHDVEDYVDSVLHKWPVPAVLVPGGSTDLKYEAFSASRVALYSPGPVAMELQLAQLPSVVAYRAPFLTEWLIRLERRVPYMSLPNIIFNEPVFPEALFNQCKPQRLASLLVEVMQDESLRERQMEAAEKFVRFLLSHL